MAPNVKPRSEAKEPVLPEEDPLVRAAAAVLERVSAGRATCLADIVQPPDRTEENSRRLLKGLPIVDDPEEINRVARTTERRHKEWDQAEATASREYWAALKASEERYLEALKPEYARLVLGVAEALEQLLAASRAELAYYDKTAAFRVTPGRAHIRVCRIGKLDFQELTCRNVPQGARLFVKESVDNGMLAAEWADRWPADRTTV